MTKMHRHKHVQKRRQLIAKKKVQPLAIDRIVFVVAIVEPMFLLPQVIQIFSHHTAAGISIITWLGATVLTAVWVWYGIQHKQKLIIMYQSLFLAANIMIVTGALLYGGRWI